MEKQPKKNFERSLETLKNYSPILLLKMTRIPGSIEAK